MKVYMIGIDLAKRSFSLHATDQFGRKIWSKTLDRSKLAQFVAQQEVCKIAIEACASCHYWGRVFRKMGHDVIIIPAQFVKPFVKSQKNDRVDAEAIVEAAMRPSMRFVPIKETWQQDLQCLHRIRKRAMEARISLSNQVRGLLAEYGVIVPEGTRAFRKSIPEVLEDGNNELSEFMRRHILKLYQEFGEIENSLNEYDREISQIACTSEPCKKLMTVPGVGPLTSTAFVAAIGDPAHFKNGRQVGAWLGLVPQQHSTGGKTVLRGITKRGDCYLRQLMVHGARSYLIQLKRIKNQNAHSEFAKKLIESKGYNKTSVALANKNARIMWALLKKNEVFAI